MAVQGFKTVDVTAYDYLKFSWETTSQSVANNSSTISWKLELVSLAYGEINSSAEKYCNITVNGQKYGFTGVSIAIGNNATKTLASGSTTIPHNADGSKTFSYSFTQQFGITFSNKTINTVTGNGSGTLDAIPRAATITGASNFTDTENPVITYSNPAGNAVTALQACISIVGGGGGDDIPYRDIPVNGTSYTFNLTAAERNTLLNAVTSGSSISVRFYVATNIGGTIYRSYTTRTFSISGANPVISVTAEDINTKTIALTGNKKYWIKGFSDIKYSINATAQKGARISSYSVICGDNTKSGMSDTFADVTYSSIAVTVTDSRGNKTRQTVTPTKWIDYNGLTCTLSAAKLDVDGTLKFTATGVYWMGSFGATSNNLTVEYRYKAESDSSWSSWTTLPLVASDNSYTTTETITGLDYRETYIIELYAEDKLQEVYSDAYTVHAAIPVFDWSKTDFKHNTDVIMSEGTKISGENLRLEASENVYINGRAYGTNKILWSGGSHMNGNQVIGLSELVSEQPNGIVLVFSYYDPSLDQVFNHSWNSFFVPKYLVGNDEITMDGEGGHTFIMAINAALGAVGAKYLIINDGSIGGHASNTARGTASGITYKNNEYVLRYVIGV